MSDCKRCDRCGAITGVYQASQVEIIRPGKTTFDICEECRKSLEEWIKTPPVIPARNKKS